MRLGLAVWVLMVANEMEGINDREAGRKWDLKFCVDCEVWFGTESKPNFTS